MEFRELLIPWGIHLLYFVGVVYLAGFAIFLLDKLFYKLLGGGTDRHAHSRAEPCADVSAVRTSDR